MQPIHLVGINGSPRDEATEAVLEKVLQQANTFEGVTTDQINLRELNFKFCTHCDLCLDSSLYQRQGLRCIHNDDLEQVYPRILRADGFIFASPVYVGNPSGLLWSFVNRLRPIGQGIADRNKTIQFIVVGGSHRNGTDTTSMALMRIAMHYKMLYVPSGTPECVGVQVVSRNPPDQPLSSGKYGALRDEIGINAASEMVKRLVVHTRLVKAGEQALGITHPLWEYPVNDPHKRR